MGKENGISCHRAKKGRRTVSPSHRVINLAEKPEGKPELIGQDGGPESLLSELRGIKQGKIVTKQGF